MTVLAISSAALSGLGRMGREHRRQYTAGLRKDALARKAESTTANT